MPKNFVTILTLTLITLVGFVVVVLAQTAFKSELPEATQQQIEPLNPEIDLNLIEELENSKK
jgi:cell division protein FtsN